VEKRRILTTDVNKPNVLEINRKGRIWRKAAYDRKKKLNLEESPM
jgi:hypothetical protein